MEKFNEGQDAQDIVPLRIQGEYANELTDYDGIVSGMYDISDESTNEGTASDDTAYDGFVPLETLDYNGEFDIYASEDLLADHSRGSVMGGTLADLGEAMRWMVRPMTAGDLSKPMITEMHETDLIPHTPEEQLQAELAKKQQPPVIKREDS